MFSLYSAACQNNSSKIAIPATIATSVDTMHAVVIAMQKDIPDGRPGPAYAEQVAQDDDVVDGKRDLGDTGQDVRDQAVRGKFAHLCQDGAGGKQYDVQRSQVKPDVEILHVAQ